MTAGFTCNNNHFVRAGSSRNQHRSLHIGTVCKTSELQFTAFSKSHSFVAQTCICFWVDIDKNKL